MASRYKKAINDASWGYNENPRSENFDKYFDEAANVCGDFF